MKLVTKEISHNNFIAIMKALGIILMVVGHSGCPNILYRFLALFHMPLFFFCSGYFFKEPMSLNDCKYFIIRRVKGLYFPYIKWCIFFLIFHNLFYHLYLYDHQTIQLYSLKDFIDRLWHVLFTMTGHEQLLDGFWFLKQLFLASIANCFISYTLRKWSWNIKHYVLILTFVSLSILSKFYGWGLPIIWDLSIVFLSMSYFYSGYFFKMIKRNSSSYHLNVLFCLFVLLLFVFVFDDNLDMLYYSYNTLLIYYIISMFGIYMMLNISILLEKCKLKNVLYYIGNHTMIILVFHLLLFKFVNLLKIIIFNFPLEKVASYKVIVEKNDFFWIVYVVIGVFASLLVGKLIDIIDAYRLKLFR